MERAVARKWAGLFVCIGLIVALTMGGGAMAQETPQPKDPKVEKPKDAPPPRVIAAYKLSREARENNRPLIDAHGKFDSKARSDEPIGLKDRFVVQVENLQAWVEKDSTALSKLVLYLDGIALSDEKPRLHHVDKGLLEFDLVRTAESKSSWRKLLAKPCDPFCASSRTFSVTVGPEEEKPFASNATISLHVLRAEWVWTFLIAFVVLLLVLFGTDNARKATLKLVRDNKTNKETGPYSLARLQMAGWFVLVVLVYVAFYAITGYYDVLSASVLALIGISAGTTAFAAVLDNNGHNQAQENLPKREGDRKELEEALAKSINEFPNLRQNLQTSQSELQKLEQDIANAKKGTQQTAVVEELEKKKAEKKAEIEKFDAEQKKQLTLRGEIESKQEEIRKLDEIINPESKGFVKDILSFGGSDTGLHRLQMIVWTIVLWAIFLIESNRMLSMPDFPGELLGLMGISAGTYVGFKAVTQ